MVRVQQVRVLPKRDATFRINVEDAHDFHAYRFAAISQLSTRSVKTVPPLAASVLMSTVVFGTSSNCDCNSVLMALMPLWTPRGPSMYTASSLKKPITSSTSDAGKQAKKFRIADSAESVIVTPLTRVF
jgi:hypothetical protein